MDDIKQITVGEVPYNIKDAAARAGLSALQNITDSVFKAALLDLFYPVGSYYESSDTTFNPNTSWGGTWVEEIAGQVHVSSGTGYSVAGALSNASDGGSKDAIVVAHIHDVEEHNTTDSGACTTGGMSTNITHSHTLGRYQNTVASGNKYDRPTTRSATSDYGYTSSSANINHTHSVPKHHHLISGCQTESTGVAGTDKNMPPYIIVKRWHRIA